MFRTSVLCSFLFASGIAFAGSTVQPIFTNIPGHATADVPGLSGVVFDATSGNIFTRPYGSPNGNLILNGFVESASSTDDQVLIVNGAVVLREGDAPPWAATGTQMYAFSHQTGINDTGEFTFTSSTHQTNNDHYVLRSDGATYTVVAREDDILPADPNIQYDTSLASPVITASGAVGFEADWVDGPGSTFSTKNLLVLDDGNTILARTGVTVPGNQAGGATGTATSFTDTEFFITPDGAHTLWKGTVSGSSSSNDVVVYDGNVVIQEGSVILGSGFPNPVDSNGIQSIGLDAAGNWFVTGDNDATNLDWVVRNGAVVAAVGQPITPAATELWYDHSFGDCRQRSGRHRDRRRDRSPRRQLGRRTRPERNGRRRAAGRSGRPRRQWRVRR